MIKVGFIDQMLIWNQNGGVDIGAGAGADAILEQGGRGFPQRHKLFAKTSGLNRHMLPP
jgi:hypothetical protein